MRTAIIGVIVSLAASQALAQEPVRSWQGNRAVVKASHLVPAMKSGEGYGEKYTFNADFGDRGSFYFSLALTNLGWGDGKMEAKGRLTIDGKQIRWKKKLDSDEWSFTKEPFSITAGPAKISGTPQRLVMNVTVGKQTIEAVMTPIAQPWRPRNGRVLFGKERKISDFTVFPLSKTELKYDLGDGNVQTIAGRGHGTRSWSELAIYEQARSTLEFRGISGDMTVYIREIIPSKEYVQKRIAYLLITKGSDILIESYDFAMTPQQTFTDKVHPNQYQVVESFDVAGKDASDPTRLFRGRISKKRLRSRSDMLKSMNAAVRAVVSGFSKPVTYEYDSDFLIELKKDGAVTRLEGIGRYEMSHLNK